MRVTDWHFKVAGDVDAILNDLQMYYPILSLTKVPSKYWNAIFYGVGYDAYYCVKVINDETSGILRTFEDLSCVADIMHGLELKGFHHVLPPLISKSGNYVHRCGGYWVIVFPWLPFFAKFNLDENQSQAIEVAERAACLLSEMHFAARESLQRINFPKVRNLPYAYKPSVWAAKADSLWSAAERSLRQRGSPDGVVEKLYQARKFGEKMVEDDPWFFDDSAGNEIIIHGDFRPENILMGPNDFSLIFDFDIAHLSYPEIDVAYGALNFGGARWLIGPRNWRVCSSFISAYQKASTSITISSQFIDLGLRWSVLKALSLSFKEEQILGRLHLYNEMLENLPLLIK